MKLFFDFYSGKTNKKVLLGDFGIPYIEYCDMGIRLLVDHEYTGGWVMVPYTPDKNQEVIEIKGLYEFIKQQIKEREQA